MRLLHLALILLPAPIWAETYTAPSQPDAVTVYSGLAIVSRTVTVDVTQGRHEVILPDLPEGVDARSLRVAVQGARLQGTRLRTDALPPQPDRDSPQIVAARARIEAAEDALQALEDRVEDANLAARAAQARATFLSGIWSSKTLPSDPAELAAVSQMIEAQTLEAFRAQTGAEREARQIADRRPPLEEELEDAQAALLALMPAKDPGALLALRVTAETAGTLTAQVSYPVDAYWQPTYDIVLDRSETDRIKLRRGAIVRQNTGEAWQDVALTLSTLAPTGQVVPSVLYPPLLRYEDPALPSPMKRSLQGAADSAFAPEAMVLAEEAPADPGFDGPGVTYSAPSPVSVASDSEGVRIAFDELSFDARVFARAVPARDSSAFMMAEARNTTAEPLLAARDVQVFVDGTLVGQTRFDAVPAGGEMTQAFGPIESLRLTRTVVDRSEGDRGLISRSNARTEAVRFEIENLGDESWNIELRDAVPYSEQDDLIVDWTADPVPDVIGVEDRRGLLQWNLSLQGGGTQTVVVDQTIRWPDGKVLR